MSQNKHSSGTGANSLSKTLFAHGHHSRITYPVEMPLQEIELRVPESRLPADVADFIEEANERIRGFIESRPVRISGFVPSDFDQVYFALEAIAEQQLAAGDVFCEWGCGFGVVAMLAAALEFQSYGIEIETSLVAEANLLAEDYDLPVDFVCGSFVPRDLEETAETMFNSELAWLDARADEAYEQLGMLPRDFDLIYAFPWPGEEDVITTLFEESAAMGALLLTFGQMDGVRVRRKIAR